MYGDNMSKTNELLETIPTNVTVIAATKYIDEDKMRNLYKTGINNFGENRVDSFLRKYENLKDLNIKWHFIGHLQKNKAKKILNSIDVLHSLDSLELAKIIQKNRTDILDCFIEVKLSDSETKDGVLKSNLRDFVIEVQKYDKINILGFMAMTEPEMTKEQKFAFFKDVKQLANEYNYKFLSIGMSDDYVEAIKAGATHIRLGRILCLE